MYSYGTLALLIRGLAPYVGKDKSTYPEAISLDSQLESTDPNIWVKPTEGKYAPLRSAAEGEKIPNYHGKKNAFSRLFVNGTLLTILVP